MFVLAALLLVAPSVAEAGWGHAGATLECSPEETSLLQVDLQLQHISQRAASGTGTLDNTTGTDENRRKQRGVPAHIEPEDFCFVHVGKSGGQSIFTGMKELQVRGAIRNLVQVHANTPGVSQESHGEFSRVSRIPGPLSLEDTYKGCTSMGNVLLWLRDPISRFVSAWTNFADPMTKAGDELREEWKHNFTEFVIGHSLEEQKHNLTESVNGHSLSIEDGLAFVEQLDIDQMLYRLFENHNTTVQDQFFGMIPHAIEGFSWYHDPCSDLSSLPIAFVGRLENMDEDWEMFVERFGVPVDLPHTHDTSHQKKNRTLSQCVVDSLRKRYLKDYVCIAKVVELGFVPREYLSVITSDSPYEY